MTFSRVRTLAGAMLVAVIVAGCGGGSGDSSPPGPPASSGATDETTEPPPFTGTPSPTKTADDTEEPSPPPEPEPPSPTSDAPEGSVPSELVGEWDGDGTAARFDKIRFSGDGGVSLLFNSGTVLEGTAVAEGTSLTLYVPGGPIAYEHWSIDAFDAGYGYTFENLRLDGVSYVRQIAGG
ncbi:hypothetical protein [Streptomyces sp. NPDC085932]|uniref:hypothetical protein n=1 Tax=Streptomyces sp. NPDC085932 TaxID=3365741 RepID=UPI0037D11FCA